MSCPICACHHGRSPICERLRQVAESLELYAVPAFLTDPCNRILWVNREFAAEVGNPVADAVPMDDRFLPALLLGPYRDRFPRGSIEVSACLGTLSLQVDCGNLSLTTERLLARVRLLYKDQLASEPDHGWDGTIVIRPERGPMRLVREQVVPLADVNGIRNGFHISIWFPASIERAVDGRPIVQDASALTLTPRQGEIAMLYAAGMSSRLVAERLGISHRTARDHLEAAYLRLGVHSRTELGVALSVSGRRHV